MNDTKEHIIKTSCLLFLNKNYKEVTLQEIVKKTGLSKGAFYHYFTSKEEVFMASIEFFFQNLMNRDYAHYSRNSFYEFYHDYMEAAKEASRKYLVFFDVDEDEKEFNINYFGLAFDALKLFPEFRRRSIEEMDKELNEWKKVIRDAKNKGEIKDLISDEELAKIYVFIGDGLAMNMIMRGVTIEDLLEPTFVLWDRIYQLIKI